MTTSLSFVDNLYDRAQKLESLGLQAEACRAYLRLLRIRPMTRRRVGQIAGRLGKLQLERGQLSRARRNLRLAVARFPDHAGYRDLLARATELQALRKTVARCREQGENDQALAELRKLQFRFGSDPLFRQIWSDHQWQILLCGQRSSSAQALEETRILRFIPRLRITSTAG